MIALLTAVLFQASPCERPEIQAHLATVEAELLAADVSGLDAEQLTRRMTHIARLAAYRERCEFPVNDVAVDRLVTVFVDGRGTHCAMGALLASDGQTALVERIRETRNTATIWELADEPELGRWLDANGLSLYEAARIQPTYCFSNRGGTCFCGYPSGATQPPFLALAEVTIVVLDDSQVEVEVTSVHGTGISVGERRKVTRIDGDAIGRSGLIVVRDDEGSAYEYVDRGPTRIDDQVQCTSGTTSEGRYCATVSYDLYVEALASEDCLAHLAQVHPELGESVCDLGGDKCGADDSGCAGGATSLFGLIALAVFRRSTKRADQPDQRP